MMEINCSSHFFRHLGILFMERHTVYDRCLPKEISWLHFPVCRQIGLQLRTFFTKGKKYFKNFSLSHSFEEYTNYLKVTFHNATSQFNASK